MKDFGVLPSFSFGIRRALSRRMAGVHCGLEQPWSPHLGAFSEGSRLSREASYPTVVVRMRGWNIWVLASLFSPFVIANKCGIAFVFCCFVAVCV